MKSVSCKWAAALLLVVFGMSALPAAAESNMIMKLGRGIANVAFGPLELLIRPYDVSKEQGNIAAVTYGVLSGVCWTVAREVVGVVDIVTFPIPLPGCTDNSLDEGWGYGAMMHPAWVIDSEHNAFNFFYYNDSLMTDN